MELSNQINSIIQNMQKSGDKYLEKIGFSKEIYTLISSSMPYPISYQVKDIDCFYAMVSSQPNYIEIANRIGTQSIINNDDIVIAKFTLQEFVSFILLFEKGMTIIYNGTVSVMSYDNIKKFLEQ